MPRIAPATTARARALRREATAEERALWAHLRHARPRFTRQLPVGRYVLDFACRSLGIAVELDGSQHLDAAGYDAERTRFLEASGWRVVRFWNNAVREDAYAVATAILAIVTELGGPTHPQPLPRQGGGLGAVLHTHAG